MSPDTTPRGFSLVEALVALALTAIATSAALPALAGASRLQRDSGIETQAALAAAARVARLEADAAAGLVGPGGSIEAAQPGWHQVLDRTGLEASAGVEVYECRWEVREAAAGILVIAVRVAPIGGDGRAVTVATAVADE